MNQMVFQIQIARRQDAVPLTRDYLIDAENAVSRRARWRRNDGPRPSSSVLMGYRQKTSVIPTGAERSEAQRRDLFCCFGNKKRSLDYAALWAASLGMTE